MMLRPGLKKIRIAKLLLEDHSCQDCEKNPIIDHYPVRCSIVEGTPEKSICKYWGSDEWLKVWSKYGVSITITK